MKLRNLILGALAGIGLFASCQEEVNLGTPKITISTSELEQFDIDGGSATLQVTASRDWMVDTPVDWVVVDPDNGEASADPQTVTVTVLPNTDPKATDREADVKFTIGMMSKTLKVSQKGPAGSAEALIRYMNDYDKEEAEKTYGSGSSWPFLDQFEGWKNHKGEGAAAVTYSFNGMSARANSTSSSDYSDYDGSGKNNMFFGSNAYLATKNISLGGNTKFELSFGTEKYSQDNGSAFKKSEFHIFLSNDGSKWVELTDYTFAGDGTEGRWNVATAYFSVPEGTENLSICMQVDVASSYRMDDLKLVVTENECTAVDFTSAVEKDFNAGGSSSGGGSGSDDAEKPATLTKATISEFLAAAEDDTWYELTGKIIEIQKQDYGNFVIEDATGEVLIYGMTNGWVGYNDKSFAQIGLKVGDTVTLGSRRGSYNGEPQGGGNKVPAYYISHVAGEGGSTGGDVTEGEYYVYRKASEIVSGKNYILVSGTNAATPISSGYGYINVTSVKVENDEVVSSAANAYVLTAVEGGYTIKQSDDRYLYMKGDYNSFNLDAEPASGNVWTIEFEADGSVVITNVEMSKTVQYDSQYNSFGCYPDVRGSYPMLYEQGEKTEAPETGDDEVVTPPAGEAGEYEPQGVTWTLGEKAYDNTSGNQAQTGKVNGVSVNNMLKLGTGSLTGDAVLHVAEGTTKLGFYCVAWKGKTAAVKFSVDGEEVDTITPKANVGATGNAPYASITVTESDYYEVELPAGATDIKVETTDPANGRVLFIGLKAIAE